MIPAGQSLVPDRRQRGFTLVELLVTAGISLVIVAGLGGVIQATVASRAALDARLEITREATFAMERMVRAVAHSNRLLLPLADRASTNWPEHIREQTVPASPPIGDSTLATAVLAITTPMYVDLDFDGFPDADNDRDGRVDEDPGADWSYDLAGGLYLIDDDGDGLVDESGSFYNDDDEYNLVADEDPLNGIDDDGDGSIDEDSPADADGDGCPGICVIDDDGDGQIDEGAATDDDEDGVSNEDWYDALVFYLDNGVLKERLPVPWDESGGGIVSGLDYVLSDLTEGVTRLRIERVPVASGRVMVDIILELTAGDGQAVSINRRVRLGSAL